jgi:hypothetical protein
MSDISWKLIDTHCEQVRDAAAAGRLPLALTLTWALMWSWATYATNYSLLEGLRQRTLYTVSAMDILHDKMVVVLADAAGGMPQDGAKAGSEGKKPVASKAGSSNKPIHKIDESTAEDINKYLGVCRDHVFNKYSGNMDHIKKFNDKLNSIKITSSDNLNENVDNFRFAEKIIGFCFGVLDGRHKDEERILRDSRNISLPGGFGKLFVMDFGVIGGSSLLLIMFWLHIALRRTELAVSAFFDAKALNFHSPDGLMLMPSLSIYSARHMVFGFQAISERFFLISSASDRRLTLAAAILLVFPMLPAVIDAITTTNAIDYPIWEGRFYYALIVRWTVLALIGVVVVMNLHSIIRTQSIVTAWQLACKKVWIGQMSEAVGESDGKQAHRVQVHLGAQNVRILQRPCDQPSGA